MKRTAFVGDCISVLGELDIQSTRLEYSSYIHFLSATFVLFTSCDWNTSRSNLNLFLLFLVRVFISTIASIDTGLMLFVFVCYSQSASNNHCTVNTLNVYMQYKRESSVHTAHHSNKWLEEEGKHYDFCTNSHPDNSHWHIFFLNISSKGFEIGLRDATGL